MRDIAATVSVAQRTALSNMISLRLSRSPKMNRLMRYVKALIKIKPMMVPITPKKLMMPKFSKKRLFLSEYPAEKMIGGSMIVKKISLLKTISPSKP